MIPTRAIQEQMFDLLGADTTTFGAASKPRISLVQAPFTPGTNLTPADYDVATFDGYAPIPTATAPVTSIDPVTGDVKLRVNATLLLTWITTGATNLPQTIAGYVVEKSDGSVVYWSALLPSGPITLTAIGQSIEIPIPEIELPLGAIS